MACGPFPNRLEPRPVAIAAGEARCDPNETRAGTRPARTEIRFGDDRYGVAVTGARRSSLMAENSIGSSSSIAGNATT